MQLPINLVAAIAIGHCHHRLTGQRIAVVAAAAAYFRFRSTALNGAASNISHLEDNRGSIAQTPLVRILQGVDRVYSRGRPLVTLPHRQRSFLLVDSGEQGGQS
jgi:hypothetical protein